MNKHFHEALASRLLVRQPEAEGLPKPGPAQGPHVRAEWQGWGSSTCSLSCSSSSASMLCSISDRRDVLVAAELCRLLSSVSSSTFPCSCRQESRTSCSSSWLWCSFRGTARRGWSGLGCGSPAGTGTSFHLQPPIYRQMQTEEKHAGLSQGDSQRHSDLGNPTG